MRQWLAPLARMPWFRPAAAAWLATLLGGSMAVQPEAVTRALSRALGLGGDAALLLIGLASVAGLALGYALATLLLRNARHASVPVDTAPLTTPPPVEDDAEEGRVMQDLREEPPGDNTTAQPPVGGLRGAWLMQTGEVLPVPEHRGMPLLAEHPAPQPEPELAPAPDALPSLEELEQQLAEVLSRLEGEATARARRPAPTPANDHEPPLLDAAAQEAVASSLAKLEAATTER